jgi:uncharacterized protein (TIGR03382 family)
MAADVRAVAVDDTLAVAAAGPIAAPAVYERVDDGTVGSCGGDHRCANLAAPGCCPLPHDCDDGDACGGDLCGGGACQLPAYQGCAANAPDAGAPGFDDGGRDGGGGCHAIGAEPASPWSALPALALLRRRR